MMEIFIDVIGWVAAVLIVGAYYFNIKGKWQAHHKAYIFCNLIGGFFFILNTVYHKAYPSAMVNVVWVIIAIGAIIKGRKAPHEQKS